MFKLTIGLELHIELLTKTKMFSPSANDSNKKINTCINPIDLAVVGTLPSVNKQAVILAIKLAKALNMEIDNILRFDRKNYFYIDLPKGFQITQFFHPIGVNGKLNDTLIERIHLEEDTAKQTTVGENIILDYNRAGVPLIEIVTKPCIHSKEQCLDFLVGLKQLLIFLEISDGKMENGSLRVDLNISVSENDKLGTRCEIKNINSFSNVVDAINYEYDRQVSLITSKYNVVSETRRYDDSTKQTIFMREKADANEYKYMTEPNITPVDISQLINDCKIDTDSIPSEIKKKLVEQGTSDTIAELLLNDFELYKIFNIVNSAVKDINLTITYVVIELVKLLKDNNIELKDIQRTLIDKIINMLLLIKEGEINQKQSKVLFPHLVNSHKSVNDLVKELGLIQITDETVIKGILTKCINNNIEMIKQNRDRAERVEKFLLGMLMKETSGQANPIISKKCLDELLSTLQF
jgi:aspartyl-tRNA(Asn)/glutamyl-tRNA(Gln) amidotransferase subunit B